MPGKRTPTKKVKSKRASRARDEQPGEDRPTCPAHLNTAARAEWDRMTRLLHPAGLLTSIDTDQLALYCTAYARWAEAERQIAEAGTVIKSPNGFAIQNPYLAIANKAMDQ